MKLCPQFVQLLNFVLNPLPLASLVGLVCRFLAPTFIDNATMPQLGFSITFIRHELVLPLALVLLVAIPLADVAGVGKHISKAWPAEVLPLLGLDVPFLAQLKQGLVSVHPQERFHNPFNLFQFCFVRRIDARAFAVFVSDHIKP